MKRIIVLLTICVALIFGSTMTADAQHRGKGHGHYKHHKKHHHGHYRDRDRHYGRSYNAPRYRSHSRTYYNRPAYNRTTVVVPAPPRPRVVHPPLPPHPRHVPLPPRPPLPPHPGLPR